MVYLTSMGSPWAAALQEMSVGSPTVPPGAAGKHPPWCLELLLPQPDLGATGLFSTLFSSLLGSIWPFLKYCFPEVPAVPCGGAVAEPAVSGGAALPSPHRGLTAPPLLQHAHWASGTECWEFEKSLVLEGCTLYCFWQTTRGDGKWSMTQRSAVLPSALRREMAEEEGVGLLPVREQLIPCGGVMLLEGEKANSSPAHTWWKT